MRIGLNATCFNDRPSGAKQRFVGIYTELFKLLGDEEFVVYEPSDCQISTWFDNPPNVVFKRTPLPSEGRIKKQIKGFLYWPAELKNECFDIFESFNLPIVSAPSGRTLLTIHDIRGIALRGNWGYRAIYRMALTKALAAADLVIAVSDTVRDEIIEQFPGTTVSVVHNGIDIAAFENTTDCAVLETRRKHSLPEEYLLAVGHFEKRKNYLNLVEALKVLHKRGRTIHLVMIGNDSGDMGNVKARIRSLKLSRHVTIFSGLTDAEVRCFYKGSKLFVFVSDYEGFGIPILEAMAAKLPMILSDIRVFKEITEGKGIYCLQDDPFSIAMKIAWLLSSMEESDRLVKYGCTRVQDFSFGRKSVEMLNIYKSFSHHGRMSVNKQEHIS